MARAGGLVQEALRSRGTRGVLAAGGIGTSVLLVLALFATYRSVDVGPRAYIGQDGIDLWVAPKGTDTLNGSAAMLPAVVIEDIAGLPAVREASPVLRRFMTADPERKAGAPAPRTLTLLAIGYRRPMGLGASSPGGRPRIRRR